MERVVEHKRGFFGDNDRGMNASSKRSTIARRRRARAVIFCDFNLCLFVRAFYLSRRPVGCFAALARSTIPIYTHRIKIKRYCTAERKGSKRIYDSILVGAITIDDMSQFGTSESLQLIGCGSADQVRSSISQFEGRSTGANIASTGHLVGAYTARTAAAPRAVLFVNEYRTTTGSWS